MANLENIEAEREMTQSEMEEFLNSAFEREFDDSELPRVEFKIVNSAFDHHIREFKLMNHGFKNIKEFLLNAFELYRAQLAAAVTRFKLIKTVSYLNAEFERSFHVDDESDILTEKRDIHIPTKNHVINSTTNLREHFLNEIISYIVRKVDEVLIEGSGFKLSRIIHLRVQIFKYEPLRGSGYIKLPKKLKGKRSVVNLKNTHDECFKYAILSALHHDEVYRKNRNKVNDARSYDLWKNELNFDGIDFPVGLNQINKFMHQNVSIGVNVYYFDEKKECVCTLFLAAKSHERKYVHLLMLTEERTEYDKKALEESTHSHFCWIKNLSSFVSKQMSKNGHKLQICDRCLIHFTSYEKLEKHKNVCDDKNDCAIEMPCVGSNFEEFSNHKNELKIPFIVYADTEAILKSPETPVFSENCSTQAHQQHEVHSIAYYFKCGNDYSKSYYASKRGENCVDWFMNELKEIATKVFTLLQAKKPINLSEKEEQQFKEATICHICKKAFENTPTHVRVRDHCHISGLFRGAAHAKCNLKYQISRNIPIVMHNLSGYDSHLLIRKLGSNKHIIGDITVIPHNSEKYISFIKTVHGAGLPFHNQIKLKFIDSLRFMTASLDTLASLIPPEKKCILAAECIKSGFRSNEMFTLLNRKGVFPYEYIDCYEKLEETTLPPKECFFSKLSGSNITEKDYEHAENIWKKFKIRTLGEYSDLYLKTDVLLLADVFENFRNTCLATHGLDPAHYFGAPGLSLDAMLKYTGVSIELFTDIDMLMFAENGIRGGVSQINMRYVKANNKYLDDAYDPSKETSYLLYLDGK